MLPIEHEAKKAEIEILGLCLIEKPQDRNGGTKLHEHLIRSVVEDATLPQI
jgi:hypothetical protein